MKKILILSLAYYPRVGGAEVAIKEITDRLPGFEWHMLTMRFGALDAQEEKLGNVVVHRIGSGDSYLSKVLFIPRAALYARRLHRQEKFDAIWAMMSYMVLPVVLGRLNIPYAITLQEGDTERHMFGRVRIMPFMPLIKKGFHRADAVSALSTYLAKWAKDLGYRGEVAVVPQGADVARFSAPRAAHQGIALVTTSRLVHKNAIDDIICALKLLPAHIKLLVAGVGPDEEALRALAARLGVEARVDFLGHVPGERLPALLQSADIFIRPSRSEGFGISFIEAMAAGLPVIATREGGLADYITSEVAWPVPKDSPSAIARAVEDIVSNPARTREVVDRARRMVAEKYTWDAVAREMREQVFARILG